MAERLNTRRTKKKAAAAAAAGVRDRFEDLPVHVLELLLSFLPSKHAVRTSMLAKRWRHLWKSVPSLHIHFDDFETAEDYSYFVNRLIELRDPTVPLHVCHIDPYGNRDADADVIEPCLQYVVSCQVQVLRVEEFLCNDHHGLSNSSVISEHLTRLELCDIRFESNHSLDHWRCQALEVLDLTNCIINLGDISFPRSLRQLRLYLNEFVPCNIRPRISAPGLVTLELADCSDLTPMFGSMPSLTTAYIRIGQEVYCSQDDCSILFEALSGATNLELISDNSPLFSHTPMIFSEDLKWRPTFGQLKTVLLNGWSLTDNFTGLVYLLQHSPTLERVTIQFHPSLESFRNILDSYTPREPFSVSKHLKLVEIKSKEQKNTQIVQIVNLLCTLGVTREKIKIDEDFSISGNFSFEHKKSKQTSMSHT